MKYKFSDATLASEILNVHQYVGVEDKHPLVTSFHQHSNRSLYVEDYIVQYKDGCITMYPKDVFERLFEPDGIHITNSLLAYHLQAVAALMLNNDESFEEIQEALGGVQREMYLDAFHDAVVADTDKSSVVTQWRNFMKLHGDEVISVLSHRDTIMVAIPAIYKS